MYINKPFPVWNPLAFLSSLIPGRLWCGREDDDYDEPGHRKGREDGYNGDGDGDGGWWYSL